MFTVMDYLTQRRFKSLHVDTQNMVKLAESRGRLKGGKSLAGSRNVKYRSLW